MHELLQVEEWAFCVALVAAVAALISGFVSRLIQNFCGLVSVLGAAVAVLTLIPMEGLYVYDFYHAPGTNVFESLVAAVMTVWVTCIAISMLVFSDHEWYYNWRKVKKNE